MSKVPSVELWKTVPDGAREVLPGGKCPRCGQPRTHRSRTRGPVERVLRAVSPMRVFKCNACQWRGWRVPIASQGPLLDLPPVPERPRRRSTPQGASGRRSLTANERLRRRHRLQLAFAIVLASIVAGSFIHCQQEPIIVDGAR